MLQYVRTFARLVGIAAVLILSLMVSTLASPPPAQLTVTSYSNLVRFSTEEAVKELRVQILSLSGQVLFDSSSLEKVRALDWQKRDQQGRPVASGVYLYAIIMRDSADKVSKHLGKISVVRGQGATAPALTTVPTVSQIAMIQPRGGFVGANLVMANDLICLGANCISGGRLYDQPGNSRTVMHGLGNKVSYVSEDGSRILMQLQTLVLNGRDTALIAGGISGTKNVAFLGDTGGNGDVLLNYAGTGKVGIGTSAPSEKLTVAGVMDP